MDVELVIKIPEEEYRWIKKSDKTVFADVASKECMLHAIKNGKLLLKGHGRLIDVNDIEWAKHQQERNYIDYEVVDWEDIKNAPTIIEADKESEQQ